MQATAQQIAWGSIGRRVIALDPRWRGGDYYDAAPGDGPGDGLAIARMVAQVTFRSDNVFTERFGRAIAHRAELGDHLGALAAVRGRALPRPPRHASSATASTPTATSSSARRWTSTTSPAAAATSRRRCRGSAHRCCRSGSRPTCSTRATSSARSSSCWRRSAVAAGYAEIDSPHGHDAFLINLDRLADPVADFLDCRKLP